MVNCDQSGKAIWVDYLKEENLNELGPFSQSLKAFFHCNLLPGINVAAHHNFAEAGSGSRRI
jgi:hypothetical protein